MSEINHGGPANPVFIVASDVHPEEVARALSSAGITGLTVRDWFAGQELTKAVGTNVCDEPALYDRLADHCYRMADAMLRARGEA